MSACWITYKKFLLLSLSPSLSTMTLPCRHVTTTNVPCLCLSQSSTVLNPLYCRTKSTRCCASDHRIGWARILPAGLLLSSWSSFRFCSMYIGSTATSIRAKCRVKLSMMLRDTRCFIYLPHIYFENVLKSSCNLVYK